MQRTQYYTPEGEKLPVALKHSHYDIPVDKVVGMFDDNNFETERLRATPINSAPNRRHFLYASDFTEEELKDLVDERQVDISKPTYKD